MGGGFNCSGKNTVIPEQAGIQITSLLASFSGCRPDESGKIYRFKFFKSEAKQSFWSGISCQEITAAFGLAILAMTN